MASEVSLGWRPPEHQVPHGTWTRERVLAALRDWAKEFGEPPRKHEWAIANAREAGLHAGRIRRWAAEYPRWPSAQSVMNRFGSWSAGLEAAGLREERLAPWDHDLAQRVETARRLTAEGVARAEIARRLRVRPATVRRYLHARRCPVCGGPVVSPLGRRCTGCAPRFKPRQWSREEVAAAIRAWAAEHGSPPTVEDWAPSADRERQWAREYPRWPSAWQAQRVCGSWTEALAGAGFAAERWDREAILEALRELERERGRPPRQAELRPKRPGIPSLDAVREELGTFSAALIAAGLRPYSRPWSKEELTEALRSWAASHGRPPGYDDWKRAGEDHPPASAVEKAFGSWSRALLAAGLPIVSRRWDRDAIIAALRSWADEHGRAPTTGDWGRRDPSGRRPEHLTVQREFGRWDAALRAAGFDARPRRWTREAVIEAMRRWATEHGRPPTAVDWQGGAGEYPTAVTVGRIFGSWPEALVAAGFPVYRRFRWEPEEILEAIRTWAAEHGRPPGRADWYRRDPHGRRPTTGTVQHHFGGWGAALEAAGLHSDAA